MNVGYDVGDGRVVEALPVLAVVDAFNRPIRWSTGGIWTSTSLAEANDRAHRANTEGVPWEPAASTSTWRVVALR